MAKKHVKQIVVKADSEFSRLFWAARLELNQHGKNATENNLAHKAAVDFAKAEGWSWAEQLLEASRLSLSGECDQALQLLAELEPLVPGEWQGLFHFVQGAARGLKGEHNEAIKAFRKALDDTRFDSPGYAWHNLGISLRAMGEHDEAINAFRKALDDPIYHSPGRIWGSLGTALGAKGDHHEAINAFRKALDDPKLATPGYAWHNLGVALNAMGEHDEAINAFRKALDDPTYDMHASGWTNLAQTYVKAGKEKQAEEAFKKSLASFDPTGFVHARARFGLQLLKSKIPPDSLSQDDRAMALSQNDRAMASESDGEASTDEIEAGIIAAIQEAGDTQYDKYIAKPDSQRDDTLSILRGWSSAVTLLEGSERRWRGGGYFLKWRGYGIVIDPGFDFLRNFHDAGYHGREINAVIVSHNHPDHNSDVKGIDDLRYELYKRRDPNNTPGMLPYVLLWDQDSDRATQFGVENPQHRYEAVVLPSGFPQQVNLNIHSAKIPVNVIPFKVNHGSDAPHAMAMVVELLDVNGKRALRIGYTADTAYFEDLHRRLADCDVLIAHISQPSIAELKDASTLKEVHLGYRGTALLLKECNPKLALIGEFWAGYTDLRIPLIKGLRQRSGIQCVPPAGLAMHLRLPSLEIECTECRKPTEFSKIKTAPPPDNYGSLAYLCPNCIIG